MRTKKYIVRIISLVPFNAIRVLLYRLLFKYRITTGSIVGYGTILNISRARINRAKIGKFNRFVGPMSLEIEEGVNIGNHNEFVCGSWTSEEDFADADYKRELHLSENVLITEKHFFDVVGSIKIRENTWIAGCGSQFWTHGAGVRDRDIEIGSDCYIGSAVRFVPGSTISNNVLVGVGSVVVGKLDGEDMMVAGVPATIVKKNFYWKNRKSND